MVRVLRLVVFVACFFAFSAATYSHAAKNGITDLAYSVQDNSNLFFTGKYQGKPVNMVRNGVIGSGLWTIYTGTPTDRVRLTIDDKKGLQEILAMDKGQRITVNMVEQERIEYRFYAPGRRFIIGSVLYRNNKRWLQGMMKTEAFSGYSALTNVSDVTKKIIMAQSAVPAMTFANKLDGIWKYFNFTSTAHAADLDDLIRDIFSSSAQEMKEYSDAPAHEIFKGALVGAAAFTVRLAGQVVAGGETVTAGSAVAIGAPLIAAVGVGVAVGLAADRTYNWIESKNLGGSTSVMDVYNRLTAPTRYTEELPPEVPNPSVESIRSTPEKRKSNKRPSDSLKELVAMSAKLDKAEFDQELEKIEACTNNRDFACAEAHIVKASKLASSYTDNELLSGARRKMSKQKSRKAEVAPRHTEPDSNRFDTSQPAVANPVGETSDSTCNDPAIIGTWNCTTGNGDKQTTTFTAGGISTTEYTGMGGPWSSRGSYKACGGVITFTNHTSSLGGASSFEIKYGWDNIYLNLPATYGGYMSCRK